MATMWLSIGFYMLASRVTMAFCFIAMPTQMRGCVLTASSCASRCPQRSERGRGREREREREREGERKRVRGSVREIEEVGEGGREREGERD